MSTQSETRRPKQIEGSKRKPRPASTGYKHFSLHSANPYLIQRAMVAPDTLTPADVLQLQRIVGNGAVTRRLQTKLGGGPAQIEPLAQRQTDGDAEPRLDPKPMQQVAVVERPPDKLQVISNSPDVTITPRATSIQRTLTSEAARAFQTAGDRTHRDPDRGDRHISYDTVKNWTDTYVPTSEQDKLIKLRSKFKSWVGKSPEPEKRLKDVIRAYLLAEYVFRLKFKGQAKRKLYLNKAKQERDKQAALLEKGVAAPETQAWLQYHGFADLVPVEPQQREAERVKGPRIDVRSTFIGGSILGMRIRAHLFIVYTSTTGKQLYFRGGPDSHDEDALTVVDTGEYTPNTIDWDPSAPSVTVLQGETAKARLDALIEATGVIDGMKVPYNPGGPLSEGENCNSVAWTILTRAGVPPAKPTGRHPGWGHILGALTPGKEHALPQPETIAGPSKSKVVAGPPGASVQVYHDRELVETAAQLPAETPVELLVEYDTKARIKYQGDKIGFIEDKHNLTDPVWKAGGAPPGTAPSGMRMGRKKEMLKERLGRELGMSEAESGKYDFNEIRILYAFRGHQGKGSKLDPPALLALLEAEKIDIDSLYERPIKKFLRTWLGLGKDAWYKLLQDVEELKLKPLKEAFQKLEEITLPPGFYLPFYDDKKKQLGNLRPESKIRLTGVQQEGWVEIKASPTSSGWTDTVSFTQMKQAIAEQATNK